MKGSSRLLQGITSNHNAYYYCMNCLYSFRTESKLNVHENITKDHDYSRMITTSEEDNVLKYTQNKKSSKTPFVVFADTELLLETIYAYDNNPEESSTSTYLLCFTHYYLC